MFKENDRMKLARPIDKLQKVGEIFRIVNIIGHSVVLVSEVTDEKIIISDIEINTYFEKVKEPEDKPLKSVSYEKIKKLMAEANIKVTTFFDKTTVVAAQFPNGFVITESFSCVDHRAYDEEEGKRICLKHIKERLLEMERYFLQEQEYAWNQSVADSKHDIPNISEMPKKEVTSEIARVAYKNLMDTFKKEYEKNCDVDFEKLYFKKLEDMSKKFHVEQEKLAKGIAEISARNIYEETMRRFSEIFGILLH